MLLLCSRRRPIRWLSGHLLGAQRLFVRAVRMRRAERAHGRSRVVGGHLHNGRTARLAEIVLGDFVRRSGRDCRVGHKLVSLAWKHRRTTHRTRHSSCAEKSPRLLYAHSFVRLLYGNVRNIKNLIFLFVVDDILRPATLPADLARDRTPWVPLLCGALGWKRHGEAFGKDGMVK